MTLIYFAKISNEIFASALLVRSLSTQRIIDSTALDIKHIIKETNGTVHYKDTHGIKSKGSDWLGHEIIVNDTFIDLRSSNKMILSKSYDGLLLVDKISPPGND